MGCARPGCHTYTTEELVSFCHRTETFLPVGVAANVFSSYLQNCQPSPLQISDVWLANGSFGFSGMENTGMKLTWCLGPEAYVSRRYLESYVNKEDAAVMAPGGEKVLDDIRRPVRSDFSRTAKKRQRIRFLQLAPKLNTSSGLLRFCTTWPLLNMRSSERSSFILPSSPLVVFVKDFGRSTVVVMVPSLSRTSTPAPLRNITVTFVGEGENTDTPVGEQWALVGFSSRVKHERLQLTGQVHPALLRERQRLMVAQHLQAALVAGDTHLDGVEIRLFHSHGCQFCCLYGC